MEDKHFPQEFKALAVLDLIFFEAGAFYIVDKGYYDFERLYQINQTKSLKPL